APAEPFAPVAASRCLPAASTAAPASAPPRLARPDESTPLQTLGEQAKPVAIPPQRLHEIAAAAAEAEHVTRERIFTKYRLRLDRQAVEALSNIGRVPSQIYPRT